MIEIAGLGMVLMTAALPSYSQAVSGLSVVAEFQIVLMGAFFLPHSQEVSGLIVIGGF